MSFFASDQQVAGFRAALNLSEQPDFVIKAGSCQWKVHSEVLSKASKFFDKACSNGFKESNDQSIILHDEDAGVVVRMILWMYYGITSFRPQADPYGPQCDCWRPFKSEMICPDADDKLPEWRRACQLYVLADKYDIPDLKLHIRRQLVLWMQKIVPVSERLAFGQLLEHLGLPILQNDKLLCETLFIAAFDVAADPEAVCNELAEPFASDPEIKHVIQRVLASELKQHQAFCRELMQLLRQRKKEKGLSGKNWIDGDSTGESREVDDKLSELIQRGVGCSPLGEQDLDVQSYLDYL